MFSYLGAPNTPDFLNQVYFFAGATKKIPLRPHFSAALAGCFVLIGAFKRSFIFFRLN